MRTLAVFVFFILIISSPRWTSGATCSKQQMIDCEMKVPYIMKTINQTENGVDKFCDNLGNSSECPLDLEDDCKTQYPAASAGYMKYIGEISKWCNRSSLDRKVWFKIAFCASMHKSVFQKCHEMKSERFNNGTFDCKYWNFISCFALAVSKYCGKEAGSLSKYINDPIPEEYYERCDYINVNLAIRQAISTKSSSRKRANGVTCSIQNMHDCQRKTVFNLQSEKGHDDFCNFFLKSNLRNNRDCPMDLDEDCKRQYPAASAVYVGFFREIVKWCTRSLDDKRAWFKVASCARKRPIEFSKCLKNYKWSNNGTFDSTYFDFVSCWYQKAFKYCDEDSEVLSKYTMTAYPQFVMIAAKYALVSPSATGY